MALEVSLRLGQRRNVCAALAFLASRQLFECVTMILSLPTTDNEAVLYAALDIAMGYFERTGMPDDHDAVQAMAAGVILTSYGRGVRHPIRLANDAINALQTVPIAAEVRALTSFYPRLVADNS